MEKALKELDMQNRLVRGVQMRVFQNAPKGLAEWYELVARSHREKICLVEGTNSLSFAECMARAALFADRIRSPSDLMPGDRLAIAGRNSVNWVISFIGATWLGAVVVPMNAWWLTDEMEYGLRDSGAVVAAVDRERFERLVPALPRLEALRCLVLLDEMSVEPSVASVTTYAWAELMPAGQQANAPCHRSGEEDAAVIMYTSGTTGFPKGVVLTQLNLMSNLGNSKLRAIVQGIKPADGVQPGTLINVPLFHATGLISALLQGFGMGRKQVIPQGKWDPNEACRLIEAHRLTQFIGVPTQSMEIMACAKLGQYDVTSLLSVGGGGASAPTRMVHDIDGLGFSAWNGYGLTETSAGVLTIAGQDYVARPQSCGKPSVLMDARIADANGNALPNGTSGELVLRGPFVFKEYWGKPEATAEAFFPDGWFRTGDLAVQDEEGFFTILDRIKDIIVRGGENISCAEVEDTVYKHSNIAEAAVLGLPHERLGEEVVLVFVPMPGKAPPSRDELLKFLGERMARYKVPSRIFIWPDPELPRSATGKTPKRIIKQMLQGGTFAIHELGTAISKL